MKRMLDSMNLGCHALFTFQFKQLVQRKARPSHVLGEIEHRKQLELLEENRNKTGGSVLGQVMILMCQNTVI